MVNVESELAGVKKIVSIFNGKEKLPPFAATTIVLVPEFPKQLNTLKSETKKLIHPETNEPSFSTARRVIGGGDIKLKMHTFAVLNHRLRL